MSPTDSNNQYSNLSKELNEKISNLPQTVTGLNQEQLDEVVNRARDWISSIRNNQDLQNARVALTGKKSKLTNHLSQLSKQLGGLNIEEKQNIGGLLHQFRTQLNDSLQQTQNELESKALAAKLASESIDITLPARGQQAGNLHPVTMTA